MNVAAGEKSILLRESSFMRYFAWQLIGRLPDAVVRGQLKQGD